jgi:hypothetical protein
MLKEYREHTKQISTYNGSPFWINDTDGERLKSIKLFEVGCIIFCRPDKPDGLAVVKKMESKGFKFEFLLKDDKNGNALLRYHCIGQD